MFPILDTNLWFLALEQLLSVLWFIHLTSKSPKMGQNINQQFLASVAITSIKFTINSVSKEAEFILLMTYYTKPSRKIESVNKAFLFWYWQWLKKCFFRNKTFFFKIEGWNFQHLFENAFRETSQSFNSIRESMEKIKRAIVRMSWMSWNLVRLHEIQFQIDTKSFSFLSWKTKKFYS